ncbi:MAG: hypothetical protein AAFW70_10650 [Cyanobacteria bacterium J06635_10]
MICLDEEGKLDLTETQIMKDLGCIFNLSPTRERCLIRSVYELRAPLIVTYKQLIEKVFTLVHNGAMQTLAFTMVEVKIYEVPQQQLLKFFIEIYQ